MLSDGGWKWIICLPFSPRRSSVFTYEKMSQVHPRRLGLFADEDPIPFPNRMAVVEVKRKHGVGGASKYEDVMVFAKAGIGEHSNYIIYICNGCSSLLMFILFVPQAWTMKL